METAVEFAVRLLDEMKLAVYLLDKRLRVVTLNGNCCIVDRWNNNGCGVVRGDEMGRMYFGLATLG